MTATDFEENLYHENLPDVCSAVQRKAQNCCSTDTVKNFLPITHWLPKYKPKFLVNDFVAGLTIGLTVVPQAIAYGIIAGLTPQYGLYSAFMGCFVYIFFGTSKDITVGPTALMSLMAQSIVSGNPDYAVLSCFLTGCLIFLMGILNLGFLMQFISIPITTGFTMAAAITIASGQINNLFGIPSPSNDFVESWSHFITHIDKTSVNDALLGIGTLIVLLLMRKIKDIPCPYKMLTKYISLSRNALAVIFGILLCYLRSDGDLLPFRVNGKITPGLPPFKIPPFSTETNGTFVGFDEMINHLGTSLISIPLIAILENIAVAKAFSKGKIMNASQEMIALGMCNLLSSFVSSMPITGSFTRTAINNASGVKTPLGGLVTGAIVLMSLAFLTQTFYYIPKATLSAIIIAAMIFMVEYDRIGEIWRSKKMDFFPFIVTVIGGLFWSLEYGMVCGILVNVLFILYQSSRPKIVITKEKINNLEICVVEVQENICFPSAEYLKSKVIKFIATQPKNQRINLVIFRGDKINNIDSTVALNIVSLRDDLKLLGCDLICWNWTISAAGVICRVHPNTRDIFKFTKTLEEIVIIDKQIELTPNDGDSSSTVPI